MFDKSYNEDMKLCSKINRAWIRVALISKVWEQIKLSKSLCRMTKFREKGHNGQWGFWLEGKKNLCKFDLMFLWVKLCVSQFSIHQSTLHSVFLLCWHDNVERACKCLFWKKRWNNSQHKENSDECYKKSSKCAI